MSGATRHEHAHAATRSLPAQALALATFVGAQIAGATAGEAGPRPSVQRAMVSSVVRSLTPLIERLQAPVDPPDWREFRRLIGRGPAAESLVAWVPRVKAASRASYELDSGRTAYRSFRLNDGSDPRGQPVPSPERPEHFPLELIHGPQSTSLLGYDLGAHRRLAQAVIRARETGSPQVVQADLPLAASGVVLIVPVKPLGGQRDVGVLLVALPDPLAADPAGLTAERPR